MGEIFKIDRGDQKRTRIIKRNKKKSRRVSIFK